VSQKYNIIIATGQLVITCKQITKTRTLQLEPPTPFYYVRNGNIVIVYKKRIYQQEKKPWSFDRSSPAMLVPYCLFQLLTTESKDHFSVNI
jgi:hypothetical protein